MSQNKDSRSVLQPGLPVQAPWLAKESATPQGSALHHLDALNGLNNGLFQHGIMTTLQNQG